MTALVLNCMVVFLVQVSDAPAPPPAIDSTAPLPAAKSAGTTPDGSTTTSAKPVNAEFGLWLVNLARHQGHLVGRSDPRSASLHVIALLEAASRAAPDAPDAHYWLYDLYLRLGRIQQARAALSHYVKLEPTDDGARLKRLELELAERQTSEARSQFVEDELKGGQLSRVYESALRSWLARHDFERGKLEEAGREIDAALRLNAMNVEARRIAYEMYGETQPELQRVEMALQLIAINPGQVNLVWDLAELLDRLSLHRQAQEWYNRAIDLHRRAEAGPIGAERWQKLAISYVSSKDYQQARDAADSALAEDASLHSARLLRANVARKVGDVKAAEEDETFILNAYEPRIEKVLAEGSPEEAAELAWYYCYHRPDPEKSLKLSDAAMKTRSPSPLAKLAHGYALSANGRLDEAMEVLAPLSRTDQLAALELARCRVQRGEKSEAITLLHKAAGLQYSGIAYELIRELLVKYGEKAGEPPLHATVVDALEKFPRDVFHYYRRTSAFLQFSIRFADSAVGGPPAGPVNLVLRLENVGPFIITFGDGFMARPLVAISAKLSGGVVKEHDNYIQVMMSERPALAPGDAIEKTVAIDVGAMREEWLASVTRETEISVTAMFDPVYQDGKLASGLGTVVAGPITAVRPAADATPAGLRALSDRTSDGDASQRMAAADLAGALLAAAEKDQAQEASGGIPSGGEGGVTSAGVVPVEQVREVLVKLLGDDDERVRAHALAAASWSVLDDSLTRAAAPLVRAESEAVRLLAVRLFAMKQGDKFRNVLEHLSRSDPSAAVRTLAASFLPEEARAQASMPDAAP